MSKAQHSKDEMIKLLTGVSDHLSQFTGSFPGLVPVVLAMGVAIADPMTNPVVEKAKVKPAGPKPVALSYSDGDLIIKGGPWYKGPHWELARSLREALNKIGGRKSQKVNPETGEPFYRTVWDKAAKGFRLPKSKEAEARAAIEKLGLPIKG